MKNHGTSVSRIFFIFVFLSLLVAPAILINSESGLFPEFRENRNLAEFPTQEFKAGNFKTFPQRFENFFNDHFGLRPFFITQFNWLKYKFFNFSSNPEVLVGKDGWLFFGDDRLDVEDYQRLARPDTESLDKWVFSQESRQTWLDELGTRFVFVVAPNKATVYEEYLPDWIGQSDAPSRIDRMINGLREKSSVDILDLKHALIENKKQGLLYHRKDSHWTHRGALVGATAILSHLKKYYPALDLPDLNDFEMKENWIASPNFSLRLGISSGETVLKPVPENGWTTRETVVNTPRGAIHIYEKDDDSLPTLVMFGDSFLPYTQRYLAEHFKRSVFSNIWFTDFMDPFPHELIADEKPDVMVYLRVERGVVSDKINEYDVRFARIKDMNWLDGFAVRLQQISSDSIEDRSFAAKNELAKISKWIQGSGSVSIEERENREIFITGDDNPGALQLTSPPIPVEREKRMALLLPVVEIQGGIAMGILDDSGQWLVSPSRHNVNNEIYFNTNNTGSIKIVFTSASSPDAKTTTPGFVINPSFQEIEHPKDRLVSVPGDMDSRPVAASMFHASGNGVKVSLGDKASLLVEGDSSQFGYQISSMPISVLPNSNVVLTLPLNVSAGNLGVGILNQSQDRWLLAASHVNESYRFNTGDNRMITIVVANANHDAEFILPSRFSLRAGTIANETP